MIFFEKLFEAKRQISFLFILFLTFSKVHATFPIHLESILQIFHFFRFTIFPLDLESL
jgi:hypothetical protein